MYQSDDQKITDIKPAEMANYLWRVQASCQGYNPSPADAPWWLAGFVLGLGFMLYCLFQIL